MVEHLTQEISPLSIDAIDALVDYAESDGFVNAARLAAQFNWAVLTTAEEVDLRTTAHAVLRRGAVPRRDPPDPGGGRRRLGRRDRRHLRSDRGAAPPPTHRTVRAGRDRTCGLGPDRRPAPVLDAAIRTSVRTGLVEDVVVALASAAVIPAEREVALAERAAEVPGGLPGGPPDPEVVLQFAAQAAPLFARGVEHVTLTEAARHIGIEPGDVAERFGSVHAVAALSFGRHVRAVTAAVDRRRSAGAAVSLTDGVYELARCAVGDPHCALALAHQRHNVAAGVPQTRRRPRAGAVGVGDRRPAPRAGDGRGRSRSTIWATWWSTRCWSRRRPGLAHRSRRSPRPPCGSFRSTSEADFVQLRGNLAATTAGPPEMVGSRLAVAVRELVYCPRGPGSQR